MNNLILSTFSNIGMLDLAFEQNGFCVVSAGDTLLGSHHDIRRKHFPSGVFGGVIGGSPCQNFSLANRKRQPEKGEELVREFLRIVSETSPEWFLLENVPQVPDVFIEGYEVQRLNLNNRECGGLQNRNRTFQFGHKKGFKIIPKREKKLPFSIRCVTASEGNKMDRRSWSEFCVLQGLPHDFDLPDFHLSGKYRAVGNGVPLQMGRVIAAAIRESLANGGNRLFTLCACNCGRIVTGNQISATPACRKRLQFERENLAKEKRRLITA